MKRADFFNERYRNNIKFAGNGSMITSVKISIQISVVNRNSAFKKKQVFKQYHNQQNMEGRGAFKTEAMEVLNRIRRNRQRRPAQTNTPLPLKQTQEQIKMNDRTKKQETVVKKMLLEMTNISSDPKRMLDRFHAQMLRESAVEGLEDFDWRQGFGHEDFDWRRL